MKKLAFMITCYDEVSAIDIAITSLRHYYSNSPVFLFCEKDSEEFKDVCIKHNIFQGESEDTQSPLLRLNEANYSQEDVPKVKRAIEVFLNRVYESCLNSKNCEYMLLHCPDTLIRGIINIPDGTGLFGSCINHYFSSSTNQILAEYGGVHIDYFGAVPAIFNIEDFYKSYKIIQNNPELIQKLAQSWIWSFSHDIIMPILFSLIGKKEEFNSQAEHCSLNPNWMDSGCPIVHQFRTFYPKRKTKYKSQE
jgi:hypothetical protein